MFYTKIFTTKKNYSELQLLILYDFFKILMIRFSIKMKKSRKENMKNFISLNFHAKEMKMLPM